MCVWFNPLSFGVFQLLIQSIIVYTQKNINFKGIELYWQEYSQFFKLNSVVVWVSVEQWTQGNLNSSNDVDQQHRILAFFLWGHWKLSLFFPSLLVHWFYSSFFIIIYFIIINSKAIAKKAKELNINSSNHLLHIYSIIWEIYYLIQYQDSSSDSFSLFTHLSS
jgi:hypothetical protein